MSMIMSYWYAQVVESMKRFVHLICRQDSKVQSGMESGEEVLKV